MKKRTSLVRNIEFYIYLYLVLAGSLYFWLLNFFLR
jgi:hypothetical protein